MEGPLKKAEFNEKDKFGLLRNSAMGVKELFSFVIYRSPFNYEDLKIVIKDF